MRAASSGPELHTNHESGKTGLFASAVNSGMRTLKMDGMEKVLMGLTDLKMVRSVCIK